MGFARLRVVGKANSVRPVIKRMHPRSPLSLYLPPSFLRVPGPRLLKLIATIKNVYCSTSEKGDDDNNDADTGGKGAVAAAMAIY